MGSFECCQAELLQQNRKWSSEPLMAGSHQFDLTAITHLILYRPYAKFDWFLAFL
jgi:hypothetical protein